MSKSKIRQYTFVMERFGKHILGYKRTKGLDIIDYTLAALAKAGYPRPEHNYTRESWIRRHWMIIEREIPPGGKSKRKKSANISKSEETKIKKQIKSYATDKEFLGSYEWRKLRLQILLKHGRKCQCCGASPETGAVLNVDHIKPRKTHPHLALDPDNLQVLCSDCNHGKGNWNTTDFRTSDSSLRSEASLD
jgi:hypothetical protein